MKTVAYAAIVLLIAVTAACTSNPPTDQAPPSTTITHPFTVLADTPLAPPQCPQDAPQRRPDFAADASECVSARDLHGYHAYLYNLSGEVLRVTVSRPCGCMKVVAPNSAIGPLPTPGDLVPSVQNGAVDLAGRVERLPPLSQVLVPAGGYVYLALDPNVPITLDIAVDQKASGASYAAKMLAAYVIDNLTRNSSVDYYAAIASCVNAIQDSWQQITQQDGSTSTILGSALHTAKDCQDLQQKVIDDPAEEQHVPAAKGNPAEGTAEDLTKVAETAGESRWKVELRTLLEKGAQDVLETGP